MAAACAAAGVDFGGVEDDVDDDMGGMARHAPLEIFALRWPLVGFARCSSAQWAIVRHWRSGQLACCVEPVKQGVGFRVRQGASYS